MPYLGRNKRPPKGGRPLVRSGPIWSLGSTERARVVANVCTVLQQTYGKPRLGNPRQPLDDLVYIVLSNKTRPDTALDVFLDLKRRYPSWDSLLDEPRETIVATMARAGLANVKVDQIRDLLRRLKQDFGDVTLEPVLRFGEHDAHAYLVNLPGVSDKVAKCVMMYTMGFDVLPVDAHVHRIARRLGWTARKRADQCHDELEELVPPGDRFAFHVDCVVHGRALCRETKPLCPSCPISAWCRYFNSERRGA